MLVVLPTVCHYSSLKDSFFNRNTCVGLVTATFAASLITSPAIGAHLSRLYSDNFIIALGNDIIKLSSS